MKSCSSSCWLSNFPMNFLTHPITEPLSHYLRLHWGWAAVGYILYFVHGTMHPELLPFQKIRLTRPCFWHASHVPSLGHNPWVPFLIWQPPPPTHTHTSALISLKGIWESHVLEEQPKKERRKRIAFWIHWHLQHRVAMSSSLSVSQSIALGFSRKLDRVMNFSSNMSEFFFFLYFFF